MQKQQGLSPQQEIYPFTYEEIYKPSGLVQLEKGILAYCGVSSIQSAFIGPLYNMNENDRIKYLENIASMALDDVSNTH